MGLMLEIASFQVLVHLRPELALQLGQKPRALDASVERSVYVPRTHAASDFAWITPTPYPTRLFLNQEIFPG